MKPLDPQLRQRIVAAAAEDLPQRLIAERFGVSQQLISKAARQAGIRRHREHQLRPLVM